MICRFSREGRVSGQNSIVMLHKHENLDRRSRVYISSEDGENTYNKEHIKSRHDMHHDHGIHQDFAQMTQGVFDRYLNRSLQRRPCTTDKNKNVLPVIEKSVRCILNSFSGNNYIHNSRRGESSGTYQCKYVYKHVALPVSTDSRWPKREAQPHHSLVLFRPKRKM